MIYSWLELYNTISLNMIIFFCTKQGHISDRKNTYVICFLIRHKVISFKVSDFSRKLPVISNVWTAQVPRGTKHHSS